MEIKNFTITKRDGSKDQFSLDKIMNAIVKAFDSVDCPADLGTISRILSHLDIHDDITVENIQNQVEESLMKEGFYQVAKSFILYRQLHSEDRDTLEKMMFLSEYTESVNAATGSKYDANANVEHKNIATLIGELPKSNFIRLNRRLLTDRIKKMYGKQLADEYINKLTHHFIYKNDETSLANYCASITMYPWLIGGTVAIGGNSTAPTNLKSFAGGFVGYAGGEFSNILNSYNNGNVSGSGSCVGGIIGEGYCDSAELINLYNTGNITSTTSGGEVGGMIGYFNESKAKLENCYNMGNIDNKAYYSGGMVGNTNSYTEKWSHCYNSGNVYAKGGNAGGIIGYGYYQELNECHNTGDITVPEEKNNSSYVGELVGGSTSKTFVNCTFLKKTTNANDNGATPKEDMTETMSIQNFVTLMNSYVTTNNTDTTKTHLKTWKLENGLPVFAE